MCSRQRARARSRARESGVARRSVGEMVVGIAGWGERTDGTWGAMEARTWECGGPDRGRSLRMWRGIASKDILADMTRCSECVVGGERGCRVEFEEGR